MTPRIFPDDWEILSAYLDGQLSDREMTQLRQRLDAQPELQRALDELQRTKMVLRSAPRRRVPRNFTLTPAMAPTPKPWYRLAPTLSFASALAFLLLVLSFGFTLLPGFNNSTQIFAAAPAVNQAPAATRAAQAPLANDGTSQSNAQPPIIIWGSAGGNGGGSALAPLGMGGGSAVGSEPGLSGNGLLATPEKGNPASLTPSVSQPPTILSTSEAGLQKSAPLEGTGPILGVRPTEEMGKIVVGSGADQSLYETTFEQTPAGQANSFFVRSLHVIQVGLLVLVLGTGLAAFFLRRRS